MTRTCSGCDTRISKQNRSGLCRSCGMRALHNNPEYVAKKAAALALVNRCPEHRARKSEAAKRRYADPAERERLSTAQRRRLEADPAAREALVERARALGARGHKEFDWTSHHRAIAEKKLSWCPADRRAEYAKLRRKLGSAEARRIIEDDLAAIERKRLASMTLLERQLERVAKGARVIEVNPFRKAGPEITLGGVSAGLL